MPRRLSFQLATLLFACGLVARAHAAELGDIKVNSFIGQHLSADIELTTLDDPGAAVQVRLASLDVYRGANLDMPGVLASVNLSVMRREGKQFLHITSTRPVDVDHLHVYLELVDGGRKGVRLATLWFAPDPTPPAPPERVAIPMAAPAATTGRATARKSALVRPLPESSVPRAKVAAIAEAPLVRVASESEMRQQKAAATTATAPPAEREAARAAAAAAGQGARASRPEEAPVKPASGEQVQKPAAAPASAAAAEHANVHANERANERASEHVGDRASEHVSKPAPTADTATKRGEDQPASKAAPGASTAKAVTPASAVAATLPLAVGQPARPALLKLPKAQAAPACTKQASHVESACVALDSKNAELRAEIGKLEARVNTLLAQQNSRPVGVSNPAAPAPVAQKPPAEAPGHQAPAPAVAPSQSAAGQIKPALPSAKAAIKKVSLQGKPLASKTEEAHGMPWGWIAGAGAAVFALVGALQFWRHRRRQPRANSVHAPLPEEEEGQVEPTLG